MIKEPAQTPLTGQIPTQPGRCTKSVATLQPSSAGVAQSTSLCDHALQAPFLLLLLLLLLILLLLLLLPSMSHSLRVHLISPHPLITLAHPGPAANSQEVYPQIGREEGKYLRG